MANLNRIEQTYLFFNDELRIRVGITDLLGEVEGEIGSLS